MANSKPVVVADVVATAPKGRQGYRACVKCGTLNHVRRAVCEHCQNPFPVKPGKAKAAKVVKTAVTNKPDRPRKAVEVVEDIKDCISPIPTYPDPFTFARHVRSTDMSGEPVKASKANQYSSKITRYTTAYTGHSGMVADPQRFADKVLDYVYNTRLDDFYGLQVIDPNDRDEVGLTAGNHIDMRQFDLSAAL